jgi:hypothetical protein
MFAGLRADSAREDRQAHDKGCVGVTETFFNRLGYGRIDRSLAPACVQATAEFCELCAASSAFMLEFH